MSALGEQLIKLGDMIGDGLADEPGGKWIRAEYARVARAMGINIPTRPRRNNRELIDKHMAIRVKEVTCSHCAGQLEQTRAGSKRAACANCKTRYQLLK